MDNWVGCYKKGWGTNLIPEAFAHPAKVSFGLSERIYKHILDEQWVKPGDCIIDPFGGIAGFALHAMMNGLNFIGVELEPRFVDLGGQNIAAWNKRYQGKLPRWGEARLLQGDSRELARLVQAAGACVSSPPWSDSLESHDEEFIRKTAADATAGKNKGHGSSQEYHDRVQSWLGYGSTPGQLGAMRAGSYDAAVSSPPYHDALNQESIDPIKRKEREEKYQQNHPEINRPAFRDYGETEGQLANVSTNTFWTSARQIVDQVYSVLRPGGAAIWVVKAYVKNKQIVPFPDQWRQMCEAAGFVTLHEHRAWLVEDRGTQIDLEGNSHTKTVERKSFFRRLAEAKGSPRIDFEVVLCMVKPGGEGGVAACISSPPFMDNDNRGNRENFDELQRKVVRDGHGHGGKLGPSIGQDYGSTPGNLGNMKAGDFEEAKKP